MSAALVLAYVATGTGAASAVAAAVSARTNLTAVRRANLPLVYGESNFQSGGDGFGDAVKDMIAVRLFNDGNATAIDVRCCLRSLDGSWQSDVIEPIRTFRPGDEPPPTFRFQVPPSENPRVEAWGVATRFQDTGGQDWETFNQRNPPGRLKRSELRSAGDW